MPLVTKKPISTDSAGNWTLTPSSGSSVHAILSDGSDTTFLSTTQRSSLPVNFATFDIADLTSADIPDGSKIKSVTVKVRVLQVAPAGGSSFLSDIIRLTGEIVQTVLTPVSGGLGDFLSNLFRHLFNFPNPTPPGGGSATWQDVTLQSYPAAPDGTEWTIPVINALKWRLGRSDLSGQLSKVSEWSVIFDYNQQPSVDIVGPTETRSVTTGATTNADATFTASTAAFTTDDIGAKIVGPGIPANTTILSLNSSTSVEMSANATATASGLTVSFTRAVISTTTRPVTTIVYSDPEGDPQDAVRFRVFTAAQVALGSFNVETTPPFASSGGVGDWLPGQSTQWLCNRDLPNGDYVVYAQVRQQWDGIGDHVSQWDAYNFKVHVDGPSVPLLTATPDVNNNWVQLDLTPTSQTPYATETYNIYSSDDSGNSWQLIWNGFQILADGVTGKATRVDYLAPLNQQRWYKALAYRTLNGIKVASDESEFAKTAPTNNEFWLKDPFAPTLNQSIGWMDDAPEQNRSQGVHIPLVVDGEIAFAIVVDGPLQGISGDSKLLFIDPDDASWEKWKAIRDSRHTLLLQYPTGEQHWIRLKGDAKWTWHTDGATNVDFRILEWGYIEVKEPKDPSAPASTT